MNLEIKENDISVSDWVHTLHNMNKITGFIIGVDYEKEEVELHVTIPESYGTLIKSKKEIILSDDTIWYDDIHLLIDLSLMFKDESWFGKWVNELKLWRKIEDIMT